MNAYYEVWQQTSIDTRIKKVRYVYQTQGPIPFTVIQCKKVSLLPAKIKRYTANGILEQMVYMDDQAYNEYCRY